MPKPAIASTSKLTELETRTKLASVMLCGEAVNYADVSNANDEDNDETRKARAELERAAIRYVEALADEMVAAEYAKRR